MGHRTEPFPRDFSPSSLLLLGRYRQGQQIQCCFHSPYLVDVQMLYESGNRNQNAHLLSNCFQEGKVINKAFSNICHKHASKIHELHPDVQTDSGTVHSLKELHSHWVKCTVSEIQDPCCRSWALDSQKANKQYIIILNSTVVPLNF